MYDEPAVKRYHDVVLAIDEIAAWHQEHTFPLQSASQTDREALSSLECISVAFTHPSADDSAFARDLVLMECSLPMLYVAELLSEPRTRFRSRRGFFWNERTLRGGSSRELEVDVGEQQTHFVGLADVSPQSAAACFARFRDGTRSCIIAGGATGPRDALAKRILLEFGPALPGITFINYLPLLVNLCPTGARVYRMGGYSGDGSCEVQVFGTPDSIDLVASSIHTLLRRSAI